MTVTLYVNWNENKIIKPQEFQHLINVRQEELKDDEYYLERWAGRGDVLLSVADLFWASQEQLEGWRMKYSDYCRELAEDELLEEDGWQEMEIEI